MGDVLLPGFDALLVGAEVVILFGEPEPALIDIGDLTGCVFEILLRAVIEKDSDGKAIEVSDEGRQVLFRLERRDAIELRLDGGEAAPVDGVCSLVPGAPLVAAVLSTIAWRAWVLNSNRSAN
jgi:hypothetical protein